MVAAALQHTLFSFYWRDLFCDDANALLGRPWPTACVSGREERKSFLYFFI
jgi:hypothetical protein